MNRPVRTYRLKRNWLESQATRDKATSSVNWTGQWAEGDYVTPHTAEYTFTFATYGWKQFDIKSMVEKWVSKPDSNFGVIMKATNEDNATGCDVRMRSSEYPDTTKPYLKVTYSGIFARNYYLKDHLDNVRVTIDKDGVVTGYDDYYPFGMQMPQRSNNISNPNDLYKYSSKELDQELNLKWYYFGARYYDPGIGRWLSVDPFADNYPDLSPYLYAGNNPILFIDIHGDSLVYYDYNNYGWRIRIIADHTIIQDIIQAFDYILKKVNEADRKKVQIARIYDKLSNQINLRNRWIRTMDLKNQIESLTEDSNQPELNLTEIQIKILLMSILGKDYQGDFASPIGWHPLGFAIDFSNMRNLDTQIRDIIVKGMEKYGFDWLGFSHPCHFQKHPSEIEPTRQLAEQYEKIFISGKIPEYKLSLTFTLMRFFTNIY